VVSEGRETKATYVASAAQLDATTPRDANA